jgi:Flp pilus assembly pilin Flp
MLNFINSFALEEDGAVTVDWVILAAGVISLSLAAVGVITDGTENISGDVEQRLESQLISTTFDRDNDV